MPPGHPFQGDQPKHLEEENSNIQVEEKGRQFGFPKLPRRPFLSTNNFDSTHTFRPPSRPPTRPHHNHNIHGNRKNEEEAQFNPDKMMAYDDFTNEDVGNIIMDAHDSRKMKLKLV